MFYSYDYYLKTCLILRKSGFNPKKILDIGASICETADIMRDVWPVAKIVLFEGNKKFESLYKIKNYTYNIKLLGKYNGISKFYKTKWSPVCSGNSIYKENSSFYDDTNLIVEELPIYKLDDLTNEDFDLIKIDTQGSELDIINGGFATFSKAKVIITEVSLINYNEGGCTKQQVIDKLTDMKSNFISVVESVLNDNKQIIAESLLFIKP
jgi:FkbM family methyltransferase